MRRDDAVLVLADGSTFEGEAIGAPTAGRPAAGELVFNTALSGYQEVLSDPSYAGQIVTFTATQIGNYGVNQADAESRRPFCSGMVIRDLAPRPSNWRSEASLESWLAHHGVAGITGIDTRRLTRILREQGSMPGAFGTDEQAVRAAAPHAPSTDGRDLVAEVTCAEAYTVAGALGTTRRVVAYDYGIKTTILAHLAGIAEVEVVPAGTPAAEVLARQPDGVFLSNGPGDPSAVQGATEIIGGLLDQVPIFGICLGHQLLGLTLGARTTKLPFGHHGGNHPVKDLETGRIEITSQNHNYALDADSIGSAEITHLNLNDGVVEGLRSIEVPAFGVQHHPEAGPGPHDSRYLFARFTELMERTS